MARVLILLLTVGGTVPLCAAEVEELDVSGAGGIYRFIMVFSDAPLARVRAVLTDYGRLSALSPVIVESEVLTAPHDDITRVRTRSRGCILFFCKDVVRVEDVTEHGAGRLSAAIVPALAT